MGAYPEREGSGNARILQFVIPTGAHGPGGITSVTRRRCWKCCIRRTGPGTPCGPWRTSTCCAPFEFSLSLAELADVVICDYNYAFDPAVHIQRIFDRRGDVTLLVDEGA